MEECELLKDCWVFKEALFGMDSVAEHIKGKFCLGSKSRCARYILHDALGADKIPDDLYPRDRTRAWAIISAVAESGDDDR